MGGPPGHPVLRFSLSTGPNSVMWPIPQHSFRFAGLKNVGCDYSYFLNFQLLHSNKPHGKRFNVHLSLPLGRGPKRSNIVYHHVFLTIPSRNSLNVDVIKTVPIHVVEGNSDFGGWIVVGGLDDNLVIAE